MMGILCRGRWEVLYYDELWYAMNYDKLLLLVMLL
jgi:hypothetical protein